MPNIFDQPDELQQQTDRQPLLPNSMPLSTPTAPIQYQEPLMRRVPTATPPATGDVPYTLEAVPGTAPQQGTVLPPAPVEPPSVTDDGQSQTAPIEADPQLEPGEEAQPLSFWEMLPVTVYNPNTLIDPLGAAPRDIPIDELLAAYGGNTYGSELLLDGAGSFSTDERSYAMFGSADLLRAEQLQQASRNFRQNIGDMTSRTIRQQLEQQRPVGVGIDPAGVSRMFPSTRNAMFGIPMSQAARNEMERPDTYFRWRPPHDPGRGWQRLLPWNQVRTWANRGAFIGDILQGIASGLTSGPEVDEFLGASNLQESIQQSAPFGAVPLPRVQLPQLNAATVFDTALRESTALQDVVRAFTPVVDEQGRSMVNPARGQFGQFGSAGVVSGLLYLANVVSPQSWVTGATIDLAEVASGAPYRARILDPLRGIDLGFTQPYSQDVPYAVINNPYYASIRGRGRQTTLAALADFALGASLDTVAVVGFGMGARRARSVLEATGVILPQQRVVQSTSAMVSNAAAASQRVRVDPTVPIWRRDPSRPAPFVEAQPSTVDSVTAPSTMEFWEEARQRALQQPPVEQARVRGRLGAAERAAARSVQGVEGRGLVYVSDTARVTEYPMLRLSTPVVPQDVAGNAGRAERALQRIAETNDDWPSIRQSLQYVEEQRDALTAQIDDVSARMRILVDDIVRQEEGIMSGNVVDPVDFETTRATVSQLEEQYALLNAERLNLTRERNLWVYESLKGSVLDPRIRLSQYAAGAYEAHARTYKVHYLAPGTGLVQSGNTIVPNISPEGLSMVPEGMVVESILYDDLLEQTMPLLEARVLEPVQPRTALPQFYREYPDLAGDVLMQRTWRSDEQLDALMRTMGVLEPTAPPTDPYRLAALRQEYGNIVSRFGPPVDMNVMLAPVKRVQVRQQDALLGVGRVTYALDRLPPLPATSVQEVVDIMSALMSPRRTALEIDASLGRLRRGFIPDADQGIPNELADVLREVSSNMGSRTRAYVPTGRERSILQRYGITAEMYPTSLTSREDAAKAYARYLDTQAELQRVLDNGVSTPEDYIEAFYQTELAQLELNKAFASNPVESAFQYVQDFADPRMLPNPETTRADIIQQATLVGLAEMEYQQIAREASAATQVVEMLAKQVADQYTRVTAIEKYIPRSPIPELSTRRAQGLPTPDWDGPSPQARQLPETPASRMIVDVDAQEVIDPLELPPAGAVVSNTAPNTWIALPPSTTPDLREFAQDLVDTLGRTGTPLPPTRRNLGGAVRALRQAYEQELAPRTRAILDELWQRHQTRLPERPTTPARAAATPDEGINAAKREIVSIIRRAGLEPPTSVRRGLEEIRRLYTTGSTPQGIIQQIDKLWAQYGDRIPMRLPERPTPTRPLRDGLRRRAVPRDEMPRSLTRLEGREDAPLPETPTTTTNLADVAATRPIDEGQELPTLEDLFRQADEIGARYQDVETSPQTEMEVRRLADQILNESGFDRAKAQATGTGDVTDEWVRVQLEQRIRGDQPVGATPPAINWALPANAPEGAALRTVNLEEVYADWQANGITLDITDTAERTRVDRLKAAMQEAAETGQPFEAIRLSYSSADNEFNIPPGYDVTDGRHRLVALRELGYKEASAYMPDSPAQVEVEPTIESQLREGARVVTVPFEDGLEISVERSRGRNIDPDPRELEVEVSFTKDGEYSNFDLDTFPTRSLVKMRQWLRNFFAREGDNLSISATPVGTLREEVYTKYLRYRKEGFNIVDADTLQFVDVEAPMPRKQYAEEAGLVRGTPDGDELQQGLPMYYRRAGGDAQAAQQVDGALPPSTVDPIFSEPRPETLPPGTIFFDDATPAQKEWMAAEGRDYMTPDDQTFANLGGEFGAGATEAVVQRITRAMVPPKKRDSFRAIASRPLFHGTKLAEGVDPLQSMYVSSEAAAAMSNELGMGVYLTTNPERARTYALALRNPDIVPAPGVRYGNRGRVLEYQIDPDFLRKVQMLDATKSVAALPKNKLLIETQQAFFDTAFAAFPDVPSIRDLARRGLKRTLLTEPPDRWWHTLRELWIEAYGEGNQLALRDLQVQIAGAFPERLQGFFRMDADGHYDIMVMPGIREYNSTLVRDSGELGRGTIEEAVMARVAADTRQYTEVLTETTKAAYEYSLLRADSLNLELAKAEEVTAIEQMAIARQRLSATEMQLESLVAEEQQLIRQALEQRAAEQAYLQTRKHQPDGNINNPCA